MYFLVPVSMVSIVDACRRPDDDAAWKEGAEGTNEDGDDPTAADEDEREAADAALRPKARRRAWVPSARAATVRCIMVEESGYSLRYNMN
mmetsp:Transcript_26393/g.56131  ORF Transcript_26393/g.56131 Transcript_26393/m.56131 type:complete len:90 (+) Transcript_26393:1021-1290(+)